MDTTGTAEQGGQQMLTGQKVAAVLKKSGVSRGRWNASGRVAGWGSWIAGVRVEPVQKFNPKAGGGIRTSKGWKRDWQGNMVHRGAWQNTGTWKLDWCSGDHNQADTRNELATAVKAFRAAGLTVTDNNDGTFTVEAQS